MVCRKHHHLRLLQHGLVRAQNAGDAVGQLLQHAERSDWLGFLIKQGLHMGSKTSIVDASNFRDHAGHINTPHTNKMAPRRPG